MKSKTYEAHWKTKRGRLMIYKRLLAYFETERKCDLTGYCSAIMGVFPGSKLTIKDLPELIAFKPKKLYGSYWWTTGNVKKRQEVLRKVIAMTEPLKRIK